MQQMNSPQGGMPGSPNGSQQGNGPKPQYPKSELRLRIPGHFAGSVIGHAGETIKQMQQDSGAIVLTLIYSYLFENNIIL